MQQPPKDAVAGAFAFANGLRKQLLLAGRRWARWPHGTNQLAAVLAAVDGVQQRLHAARDGDTDALVAESIAQLRAVLEWTTYQSAAVATARAVLVARRTRTFAERLGVLDDEVSGLARLRDSERSLIDNIRTKNGYLAAVAERHPELGLPGPLIDPNRLVQTPPKVPGGRLALIARLRKSVEEHSRKP